MSPQSHPWTNNAHSLRTVPGGMHGALLLVPNTRQLLEGSLVRHVFQYIATQPQTPFCTAPSCSTGLLYHLAPASAKAESRWATITCVSLSGSCAPARASILRRCLSEPTRPYLIVRYKTISKARNFKTISVLSSNDWDSENVAQATDERTLASGPPGHRR